MNPLNNLVGLLVWGIGPPQDLHLYGRAQHRNTCTYVHNSRGYTWIYLLRLFLYETAVQVAALIPQCERAEDALSYWNTCNAHCHFATASRKNMDSSCEASIMDYGGYFSGPAHNAYCVLEHYATHLLRLLIYWRNTELSSVERALLRIHEANDFVTCICSLQAQLILT
jgi:hypothetical protein